MRAKLGLHVALVVWLPSEGELIRFCAVELPRWGGGCDGSRHQKERATAGDKHAHAIVESRGKAV